MNLHEAVMEAHRDFIRRIRLVFDPRSSIVEQLVQRDGNFIEWYPEIAFARAELPGPSPNVAEHPLVQVGNKLLAQRIAAAGERPVLRAAMFSCSASFSSLRYAMCAGISSRCSSGVSGVASCGWAKT